MGYGSRALELLTDFYEGKFTSLSESDEATIEDTEHTMARVSDIDIESSTLLADDIKVRDINNMPPLFSKLSERRPDPLDYIGVSYGLTQPLHKFWKRHSFAPVYLRQNPQRTDGRTLMRDAPTPLEQHRNRQLLARRLRARFPPPLPHSPVVSISAPSRPFKPSRSLSPRLGRRNSLSTTERNKHQNPSRTRTRRPSSPPSTSPASDSYANNCSTTTSSSNPPPVPRKLYFTGPLKIPAL